MTEVYDWNPMPHTLDVLCPKCNKLAYFEFAEIVRIKNKKDIPYFKQSEKFEYITCKDSCGHTWHGALYFAGMHGRNISAIDNLPDGYQPSDWSHSKYLIRHSINDIGYIDCSYCGFRNKHILEWPKDAYYKIDYKNEILWAFNKESAHELVNFINMKIRLRNNFKWKSFLINIPSIFLNRKARTVIINKMNRLLNE